MIIYVYYTTERWLLQGMQENFFSLHSFSSPPIAPEGVALNMVHGPSCIDLLYSTMDGLA